MNTKRYMQLLFAIILVVAAVFAFQALHIRGSATKSNSTYVGMGDLRRLEADQALSKAVVIDRNESYTGMGDLRRLEAAQALPKALVIDRNQAYAGMGDLRRYEFEQEEHNNK